MICFSTAAQAQKSSKKQEKSQRPKTETELVDALLAAFGSHDVTRYLSLFPDMEVLTKLILESQDPQSSAYQLVFKHYQNPTRSQLIDSVVKQHLSNDFDSLMVRSARQRFKWERVILNRFELIKKPPSKDSTLNRLIPERFYGDVFFTDILSGYTYGMRVTDMHKMKDEWYGGQVLNVFPVDNSSDLNELLEQQKRMYEKLAKGDSSMWKAYWTKVRNIDSTNIALDELEEAEKDEIDYIGRDKRDVVERKFYTGYLDGEIPIEIYIRYLKGNCGDEVCGYDGVFKYDKHPPVLLKIRRNKKADTWHMEEMPENGLMDLLLESGRMTGTWISVDDKTEFGVDVSEDVPSGKYLRYLDKLLFEG